MLLIEKNPHIINVMETVWKKEIKTVSDFKKLVRVGAKVGCLYYNNKYQKTPSGEYITETHDRGVREASIVQSNSFALKTIQSTGEIVDSWCSWPKASECKIEHNILTIFDKDMRYFKGGLASKGNPDYDSLPDVALLSYWIEA